MIKRLILVLVLCFGVCALCGCSPALPSYVPADTELGETTESESGSENLPEPIPLLILDGRRYSFSGDPEAILAKDDSLILRRSGTYRLSGELTEGELRVDVGWEHTVRLILDGVSLASSYHPCLSVESAAAVILESSAETVNRFHSKADSVIRSEANVIFCGKGALSLGGAKAAVTCAGTVSVTGGGLTATASEYGILAADRLLLEGGSVCLNAAKVGIRVTDRSPFDGGIRITGGSCTVLATECALFADGRIELGGGSGSLSAPILYRYERQEDGQTVPGVLLFSGGDFPRLPS